MSQLSKRNPFFLTAMAITLIGLGVAANKAEAQSQSTVGCPPSKCGSSSSGSFSGIRRVIVSSYQAVFGRNPNIDEINYWIDRSRRETVNMNVLTFNHRNWLREGGDLDGTIVRSYPDCRTQVLQRLAVQGFDRYLEKA
jgi:hypothetical protein